MLFKGTIETDVQGSECEFEFEIDSDELAAMTEAEREEAIEAAAREAAFDRVEWSYWPVDDPA